MRRADPRLEEYRVHGSRRLTKVILEQEGVGKDLGRGNRNKTFCKLCLSGFLPRWSEAANGTHIEIFALNKEVLFLEENDKGGSWRSKHISGLGMPIAPANRASQDEFSSAGNAVANIISGVIAIGIGNISSSGLEKWRMLFLILGGVTVAYWILLLFLLPASPSNARFLSIHDREIAVHRTLLTREAKFLRPFSTHKPGLCASTCCVSTFLMAL